MAETKDSRGKEPLPRKNDPTFSHSPDGDEAGVDAIPAGKRRSSKRGSWFQQNQTIVIGVAVGVTLLVIVLVLCWMSGLFGDSTKPKPPAMAAQPVATPSPQSSPQSSPQPAPPQTPPPTQPDVTKEEPKKEEPKKEEEPPLPDDVAKWNGKQGDYHRARRENHPKLLEAIVRLGEKYPGSEPIGRGLTDLLKPLPPEKEKEKDKPSTQPAGGSLSMGAMPMPPPGMPGSIPGVRPYGQGDLPKLVETIVEALGRNGSKTARDTLEQILAGTFVTDDDKMAVEATLKTLVAHPSDENDALLLRVLTNPDALRPESRRGAWSAREMKAKAFEFAKQLASINLRTNLARALVEGHARIDPKDPMDEFLLVNTPLNCGAQAAFYEKANPSKELKVTLEQQLVGYSGLALSRFLGIPSENPPQTAGMPMMGPPMGFNQPMPFGGSMSTDETVKPAEVDIAPQLAGHLWSSGFRGLLEPQLAGLKSFEKQPQLVLLAATIPHDSTRAALFKTLRKHWSEGPKALEAAGLTDRVLTDPGLLAMIKLSPRKESVATPRAADAGKAARAVPPVGAVGGNPRVEAARKELQAKQDWMDASAKLVTNWCKRFEAATTAKEADLSMEDESPDKPSAESSGVRLPSGFELASGAKVLASHRVFVPEATPAGFSKTQPDTLEVYYVRAEELSKPKRATAFYRSQAGPTAVARTTEGKTWIDSIRPGSQKDRRRSIDVLITRPGSTGGPGGMGVPGAETNVSDDEVDLIIEVLVIEIKDPSKDQGKDSGKDKDTDKDADKDSEKD